jgi:hypothetical protein
MDLANNIKTIKGDTGATGIPGMQGVTGPMGMTGYSIYPYPVYSEVDIISGTTQAFIGANNPRIGDFFVLENGNIYKITSITPFLFEIHVNNLEIIQTAASGSTNVFTKDDTVVKYTTEPSTGYNTMFLNGGGLTAADFTGYNVNPSLCISRVRGTENVGSTPTTGTLLLTSSQLSGQQHTLDEYSDSLKIFHSVYNNMRVGVFSMHGESSRDIVTGFNFIHNPITNSNGHGSVIIGSSAYVNNLYGVSNSAFDSGITILKGDALSVGVDSGGGVISTGQKLNIKSGAGLSLESGAGAFEFNTTGSGITVSYNKATTFNVTSGSLYLKSSTGYYYFNSEGSYCGISFDKGVFVNTPGNITFSSATGYFSFFSSSYTAITVGFSKATTLDVTGDMTLKSSTGKYYFDTAASDCTIDFNKNVTVNTQGNLSFSPSTGGVYFNSGSSTAITVGFNKSTALDVTGNLTLKSSTGKYYFDTAASDCTIDFNKATTLNVTGDLTVNYGDGGSGSWSNIYINSSGTKTGFITFNSDVILETSTEFEVRSSKFTFDSGEAGATFSSYANSNGYIVLQLYGIYNTIVGTRLLIDADTIDFKLKNIGTVTVEEIYNHIHNTAIHN